MNGEGDDSTEDEEELVNVAALRSTSHHKQAKTVVKKFDGYIQSLFDKERKELQELLNEEAVNRTVINKYHSFEECYQDREYFTKELVGKFFGYLCKEGIKTSTIKAYLSSFKGILQEKIGERNFRDDWWAHLRANIKGVNINQDDEGAALLMEYRDFTTFCKLLIKRDDHDSIMNRALLHLQWQCVGRIDETVNLSTETMRFVHQPSIQTISVSEKHVYTFFHPYLCFS